jgi:mono/diheme cytochrome c family protein
MKKLIHFIIIVITITGINISCSSRKSIPIAGARTLTDPHEKNGQAKFMQYCNKCHPQGEAGLGPALNSNPAPKFIKAFQVRHGLGVMPSFKKDEISDEELKDITSYLSALRRI